MSDYLQRQAREDAAHEIQYAKWVKSLSLADREKLRKANPALSDAASLDKPYVTKKRGRKDDSEESSQDPAESNAASFTPDIASAVDSLAEILAERFRISIEAAKQIAAWHKSTVESESIAYKAFLLQRMIAAFIEPGNLRLRAGGLAFAANLAALNGVGTLRDFAARINVSPAAVSKVKKWWQTELALPPSPHGKSREACANYSTAQKNKHWRYKKCKAIPSPSRPSN